MNRRLLAIPLCFCFASCFISPVRAEEFNDDKIFISLTRTPVKLQELPTNVSVITTEEIKESGAKSMADVLNLVPSADPMRSGSQGSFTAFRMRAVPSSAQVQVVVDDQPLGGVSQQFIDLSQIPIDNIERVEVVRGGSSVLYGANTIGGVVHIITKKNVSEPASLSAGFEGGSFKTKVYNARAGASEKEWNGFATVSKYNTDGFQENSDASNLSATATAGYSFENAARIALDLTRVDHEVGNPQGTTIPIGEWDGIKERAAANKTGRVEQDKTEGRLNLDMPLLNKGTLESVTFGSRQNYLTRPSAGVDPDFKQLNKIMGNDTRLHLVNGLTLGGSFERDERHNDGDSPLYVTNVGGFLQQEFAWEKLRMTPAVRVDHHSSFGTIANPRLTSVYTFADWWSVSGNVARAFRAPSFLELFFKSAFFNGNPDLKPERAWTYDLGNQFRLGKNHTLKLTGYFTRIEDRIAANSTTYENLPKAETSGLEVETSGTFDLSEYGRLRQNMAYTYQRAQGNSDTSSTFVPLRLTPTHLVTAQLSWTKNAWTLTNIVRYVSEQFRLDNNGGERLPPYAVWNARLAKGFKFVEVFASIDNITDRRYAESFDSDPISFATTFDPQPTRAFWSGVNVKWQCPWKEENQ